MPKYVKLFQLQDAYRKMEADQKPKKEAVRPAKKPKPRPKSP